MFSSIRPRTSRVLRPLALAGSLLAGSALSPVAAATLYPVVVNTPPDRLMLDLVIPPGARTQGMWGPVDTWPLVGLHLAVLPNGELLSYGATGDNGGTQDARTFDVWDPSYGLLVSAHKQFANAPAVDSFCSAGAVLSNGNVMTSGGSSYADDDSPQASTSINPTQLVASPVASMLTAPRWYASMTTLPDGRDLITGGGVPYSTNAYSNPGSALAGNQISITPEVFTQGSGWSSLLGASSRDAFGPDDNRWWYPRQWVAPNGKVFGITATQMWYLDPAGKGSVQLLSTFSTGYSETTLPNIGPTSTATMYRPGQVLQVGGNGRNNGDPTTSSSRASVFDVRTAGSENVRAVASMTYPRQWANSVSLANGQVLVTGGTTYGDTNGADAVYAAETWDPVTEKWTVGASAAIYRSYHTATILLPDGAVLSSGGGVPGPVTNLNAEVYYPPYLFTASPVGGSMLAPRPALVSLSANALAYNASLGVEMKDATKIASVALIRLGVVTHGFNSAQAYVVSAFTQKSNVLSITMPASAAVAPPGYYQVVAINAAGVPSRGSIVSLGSGVAAPPVAPVLAAAQPAGITTYSNTARKISVGADGSMAFVDVNGNVMLHASASAAWTTVPGLAKDIAVVGAGSLYAIGTDDNVYHWRKGGSWVQVGVNAASIAASSDGAAIVTNLYDQSIWLKPSDDDQPNWRQLPATARRVALSSRTNAWMIGIDSNVYHLTGGAWNQVGVAAQAISARSDGGVAVINNVSGAVWAKNNPANDADGGWTNLPGIGNELALRSGTGLWLIDVSGRLASN